ncbi:CCL16 isoform 2 [Pongo abelii]|uniref:CCL16 isoform 2 n=1 Tax=Pongo abelii TaxID=9601 RepID=A0A2J8RCL1_PONAB|nr:CCL16 isoform 2 [Pongo abelii]
MKVSEAALSLLVLILIITSASCSQPSWSAVARSQLTTTSASWVQVILLPQSPE